jgi:hypothetical protein
MAMKYDLIIVVGGPVGRSVGRSDGSQDSG